jgi:hypothetical protein
MTTEKTDREYRIEFVDFLCSCLEAISRGESFRVIVGQWMKDPDARCAIQLDYEDAPFRSACIPPYDFDCEIREALKELANKASAPEKNYRVFYERSGVFSSRAFSSEVEARDFFSHLTTDFRLVGACIEHYTQEGVKVLAEYTPSKR